MRTKWQVVLDVFAMLLIGAAPVCAQLNGTYNGSASGQDANGVGVVEADTFQFSDNLLIKMNAIEPLYYTTGFGTSAEQCWFRAEASGPGLSVPYNLLFLGVFDDGSSGYGIGSLDLVGCSNGNGGEYYPPPAGGPEGKSMNLTVTPQSGYGEFDFVIGYTSQVGMSSYVGSLLRGHAKKQ